MQTFSEEMAGRAFSRMARSRFSDPDSRLKPTDVCLYAWLVAEAARVNCNPFSTTLYEIFTGGQVTADGRLQKIAPVGLSYNTIKAAIVRLEELGYLHIDRTPSTRGQRLSVEITE